MTLAAGGPASDIESRRICTSALDQIPVCVKRCVGVRRTVPVVAGASGRVGPTLPRATASLLAK